jgi:23S rRNA (pseudouridine1915-N3)-methyltransferase
VRVTVLVVGRAGTPFRDAIHEYEERAARYWKLQVIEVSSGAGGKGKASPERVTHVEEVKLLNKIPSGAEVVALTRQGKAMTSTELARYLGGRALASTREVCFVVGGAYGLGPRVMERADRTLSLSSTTLPHQMARLLLAEQVYRAGTILRKEPYHKGGS